MKKFLSFFLLSAFLLWTVSPGVTLATYESPEYLYERVLLQQSRYGHYVEELEQTFPLLSDEKIQEIYARVWNLSYDDADMQHLVDFIVLLCEKELNTRVLEEKEEDETIIAVSDISEREKETLSRELQTLQSSLSSELIKLMQNTLVTFEEMQNYEQKWDFTMNLGMNIPEFFEYSLWVELEDYISETHGFDSRLKTGFDLNLDMETGYESFDGELSGKVEVITLWGDIYLKVWDISLNASELFEEEFWEIIEKLNELWDEDTYLHYKDMSSEMIFEALENFHPDTLESQLEEIENVQFFEGYGKEGDAYLLRPTLEFCSFMKSSLDIFDPFRWSTCSEGQYEDMLSEMHENGYKILLSLDRNNTLSFIMNNDVVKGSIDLVYNDYSFVSLSWDFYEPENSEVNHITFEYLTDESLSFVFKVEDFVSNGDISFGRNGEIEKAEIDVEYEGWSDAYVWNLTYNRGALEVLFSGDIQGGIMSCSGEWNMTLETGDFSGGCTIEETDYYGEEQKYTIELNTNYDLRNSTNNIDFEMLFWDDETLNFYVDFSNVWTKRKIDSLSLSAPEKTQEYYDFMFWGSSYDDGYSDSYYSDDYDFGYEIEETEFDDYSQTCYIYDDGEKDCTKFYEDRTEYCYEYPESPEDNYCSISTDEYYYDGYSDIYYYDDYQIDGKTGERTDY